MSAFKPRPQEQLLIWFFGNGRRFSLWLFSQRGVLGRCKSPPTYPQAYSMYFVTQIVYRIYCTWNQLFYCVIDETSSFAHVKPKNMWKPKGVLLYYGLLSNEMDTVIWFYFVTILQLCMYIVSIILEALLRKPDSVTLLLPIYCIETNYCVAL